jgi:hypothetical protein
MRSIEFLREEGAGNDQPMSDAAYAAQRAQGEKNLNAVKGFFGGKPAAPAAANPAPPGTSIDPIVRQRLGYGPATQKEIADYQATNPNYGKLVSSDGRPVQSGTPGVTWNAGGEQAVTKAAQTAAAAAPVAPPTTLEPAPLPAAAGSVDPNAGELGNQTPSTRIPSDEKYPRTVAPAAPANRDSMPFKQAFADARASGVPTFTWKGKSYSTQLAKQSATPNPFPAGTVKNAAGGLTTTNAGGAATSVTRNSRPVVPGSLRAIQQNNQAAAATGKQPTVLPAAPAAPSKPGLGTSPMRESKFDESVNLMRRLSTMLKG